MIAPWLRVEPAPPHLLQQRTVSSRRDRSPGGGRDRPLTVCSASTQQLVLARPAPVHRRLGHAGPSRDRLDGQARVAVLGQQLDRGSRIAARPARCAARPGSAARRSPVIGRDAVAAAALSRCAGSGRLGPPAAAAAAASGDVAALGQEPERDRRPRASATTAGARSRSMPIATTNEFLDVGDERRRSRRSRLAFCAASWAGVRSPRRGELAARAAAPRRPRPTNSNALPIDWLESPLDVGAHLRVGRQLATTTAAGWSSLAGQVAGASAPRWPRKTTARIEPRMATPSAPATWRTVLLTADPAPAFSRGTALMIAFVAGAIVRPMPEPMHEHLHLDHPLRRRAGRRSA